MPEFNYKARNSRGQYQTGTLNASDRKEAQAQIRSMRLTPVFIKADSDSYWSRIIAKDRDGNIQIQLGGGLPSLQDVAVFSKQFSIMIERGVPIMQTLVILAGNQKKMYFAKVIEKVRRRIENGATLSAAFEEFPKIFNRLYVSMIRAGEVSGNLDSVLKEIVKYLEKASRLRGQIKSALVYPVAVMGIALAITYAILVFLVPTFAEQYATSGQELPFLTQIIVNLSNIVTSYLLEITGTIVGGALFFNWWRQSPQGKPLFDKFLLIFPLTQELVKRIAISRFCSTMSVMMSSGVSILDSLTICAESSGNAVIEKNIMNVKERISGGSTFADPLAQAEIFPPMVVSMVAVGEQTGALDETLGKISEIYEEEVDLAIKSMTALFQPIMIVGIGAMLGFVVIALYLPIFDQASNAGG